MGSGSRATSTLETRLASEDVQEQQTASAHKGSLKAHLDYRERS